MSESEAKWGLRDLKSSLSTGIDEAAPDVDGVELLDKLDEEVDGERRNLVEKPPKAEEPALAVLLDAPLTVEELSLLFLAFLAADT